MKHTKPAPQVGQTGSHYLLGSQYPCVVVKVHGPKTVNIAQVISKDGVLPIQYTTAERCTLRANGRWVKVGSTPRSYGEIYIDVYSDPKPIA